MRAAILLLVLTGLPAAYADSAASKNKQGNRLFQEGKYEEAQKAYVEAQAQSPDKPEILYNVGNSLIKQKKYDQALQSLRQAVAKADRGLQASGWYNSGNALYESGNYQDAAQAYIQALRSNPSDRDAKHNLELALRKKQEQQNQQNPKQNQDKKDQQTGGGQSDQAGDKNQKSQPDKGNPQAQNQPNQQDAPKPATPQSTKADRREGSFSKERALQILDALQNQELAEQRKLLERRARRKATGKDW